MTKWMMMVSPMNDEIHPMPVLCGWFCLYWAMMSVVEGRGLCTVQLWAGHCSMYSRYTGDGCGHTVQQGYTHAVGHGERASEPRSAHASVRSGSG